MKVQKAYDGEKTAFEAMKLVAPLANALREPPPLLRRARYWEKARAAALALEERHQELARIVDDLPELKAGLPSGVALTHFKVSDPDRTEAQADWWRYLAQIVDFTHRFDITYRTALEREIWDERQNLCAELGFQRESEICADVAMEYDGTFEREVFEKWGKYTAGMELVEQALKR